MNRDDIQMFDMALSIAIEAHKGQMDKGGEPYILHPLRLMLQFEDKNLQIIALLHDVIEDSDFTIIDLEKRGFTKSMIEAVDTLTKRKGEDYNSFISRVLANKLAVKVKIVDIQDNLNIMRLNEISDNDIRRINKYKAALAHLKSSLG